MDAVPLPHSNAGACAPGRPRLRALDPGLRVEIVAQPLAGIGIAGTQTERGGEAVLERELIFNVARLEAVKIVTEMEPFCPAQVAPRGEDPGFVQLAGGESLQGGTFGGVEA